jgi:hypothetical protein
VPVMGLVVEHTAAVGADVDVDGGGGCRGEIAGLGFGGGSIGPLNESSVCAAVEGRVLAVSWAMVVVGESFDDV